MFAEPTFIVSLSGLCGFILVVEDGEVDAYTPSGDLRRPASRPRRSLPILWSWRDARATPAAANTR